MSLLNAATKVAVIGAAAAAGYFFACGNIDYFREKTTEPGFVNPSHVELYKPTNENGNVELFLNYENGTEKLSLPIKESINGPLVGSEDYQWSNMAQEIKDAYIKDGWSGLSSEIKSELVELNWDTLLIESRKNILKTSLEGLIENYGAGKNE